MAKTIAIKLKEGDPAPGFTTLNQDGSQIQLSQFKGKHVVLYFYPRDNTPGCTTQACSLRDHYAAIKQLGVVILGVSTDTAASHQKFATKYELPFDLLADTSKEIVTAYGVWGTKQFMGKTFDGVHRVTFWINPEGNIQRIWTQVKPASNAEEILEALKHQA